MFYFHLILQMNKLILVENRYEKQTYLQIIVRHAINIVKLNILILFKIINGNKPESLPFINIKSNLLP